MFLSKAQEVKTYSESINTESLLQEMVNNSYTEENYEFAKVLEDAYLNEYNVHLSEDTKEKLSEQVFLMEQKLESLKNICSLQEGFGFISWWKVHAVGSDLSLGDKVTDKIQNIKTEEDKKELIADLQKVKRIAKSNAGTKDKAKGELWNDIWVQIKRSIASSLLLQFSIVPALIKLMRDYDGTTDDFIKGIDALIKDVQAVKIKK